MESGGRTALGANDDVVVEVFLLKRQAADMQRLVRKKSREVEIVKDAPELLHSKKLPWRDDPQAASL